MKMYIFQKRSSFNGLTQDLRMMLFCVGTLVGSAPLVGCSGGVENPPGGATSSSDSISLGGGGTGRSSNGSDDARDVTSSNEVTTLRQGETYQIQMKTPGRQTGIVASWNAHSGLVEGGNPLLISTGDYRSCIRNDCDFTFTPIEGKLDTYIIGVHTPGGKTGIVASRDAHRGLVNGGNPLVIHTGDYRSCPPNDCDFIVAPIEGKPNTFSINVQTPDGKKGIVASWNAHSGLVNGGNPLLISTGDYGSCVPNDCDFIISTVRPQ
jgi:hypothetical protein